MKRIIFLMASVLCVTACNNEIDTDLNIPKDSDVRITLKIPDAQVFTYSTATERECYIFDLWILEFDSNTLDTAVLIDGADIAYNGQATQMLPQLPFEVENGHKIILLANTHITTLPPGIITPGNINTMFSSGANVGSYFPEGSYLPMYGEIASWGTTYDCEMIRAIAKIQVRLGETFTDLTGSNAWPNGVYCSLVNVPIKGEIQPSSTITGIPADPFNSIGPMLRLLQFDVNTTNPKSVCIYEYNSSTRDIAGNTISPTVFEKERLFLHIMTNDGLFHWRLDFYDSNPTSPTYKQFIDVKRNCHYIFTINRVSSPGYYATGMLYYYNPGSNIEYMVEVRDGANHITSNGQYAVVTSVDTAYVSAGGVSGVTVATVRYVEGNGMTLYPTTLSPAYSGVTSTAFPANADLTVHSPTSFSGMINDTNINVVISTTPAFTEGTIEFKLGNIYHRLAVKAQ
ncbi:MAG: hypothetical protein LBE91_09605 [Tannerella sp.]|jgi:hypothetical protein|nr:hypothetical protein [Tannerella sp.]